MKRRCNTENMTCEKEGAIKGKTVSRSLRFCSDTWMLLKFLIHKTAKLLAELIYKNNKENKAVGRSLTQ